MTARCLKNSGSDNRYRRQEAPTDRDSAYRSKEREERPVANEFESQIHEKGARGHP